MKQKILLLFVLLLCCAGTAFAERLLISTDLHISDNGEIQKTAMEQVLTFARQADVLVLMGDLANTGYPREHAQIVAALESVDTHQTEVYVLPGNHDLNGEATPAFFKECYHAFGYDQAFSMDPGGLSYAVMTRGGTCLLMLDTNAWDEQRRTVSHGETSDHLITWVKETLETLGDTPVLVFGHHPLLPFEGNDVTGNAEPLVSLLTACNANIYFSGHRHSNYSLHQGTWRQINVGIPWSYPAYVGLVTLDQGIRYEAVTVFEERSDVLSMLREESFALARRMAEGSLEGTQYEGDEEAIAWFLSFFAASQRGQLKEHAEELKAQAGYLKWQKAEVRSAVKPWVLNSLEQPAEDYHRIVLK